MIEWPHIKHLIPTDNLIAELEPRGFTVTENNDLNFDSADLLEPVSQEGLATYLDAGTE